MKLTAVVVALVLLGVHLYFGGPAPEDPLAAGKAVETAAR